MKVTLPADELATAASWVTATAVPECPTSPVLAQIQLTAPAKPAFITPAESPRPGPAASRHILVPIRNAG